MTGSPYRSFKEKLRTFAGGQAGIRNPFVIAAVDPSVEHRVAERLSAWATGANEVPPIDDGVTVQPIWLDELLPTTKVYNLSVALALSTQMSVAGQHRCASKSIGWRESLRVAAQQPRN